MTKTLTNPTDTYENRTLFMGLTKEYNFCLKTGLHTGDIAFDLKTGDLQKAISESYEIIKNLQYCGITLTVRVPDRDGYSL